MMTPQRQFGENRGITIQDTPVGTPEFVARQLEKKVSEHEELLNKIPDIKDIQCVACVTLLGYCKGKFLSENGGSRTLSRFRHPA